MAWLCLALRGAFIITKLDQQQFGTLPGQRSFLQTFDLTVEPLQPSPPCCGAGFVQLRSRVSTPLPQVTLQGLHKDQPDHPPWTETIAIKDKWIKNLEFNVSFVQPWRNGTPLCPWCNSKLELRYATWVCCFSVHFSKTAHAGHLYALQIPQVGHYTCCCCCFFHACFESQFQTTNWTIVVKNTRIFSHNSLSVKELTNM